MSTNENQYQYHEYESEPFQEQWEKPNSSYSRYSYADPSLISSVIFFLLIATILVDSVGIIFGFGEATVLQKIQSNSYESHEAMQAAANSSDLRVGMIGLLQMAMAILLGIVFLFWTHRVCKNAHSFNTVTMTITPGWAVGWYFIPIFNLWKPYLALREAFHASCHPEGQRNGGAAILGVWWLVHITTGILGQISFRMALSLGEIPDMTELIVLNGIQISADFVGVLLNVLTLIIVQRFARCQRETVEKINENFV